jgi:hypothetical protein
MQSSPSNSSPGTDWNKLTDLAREMPVRIAAAYSQERKQAHNLYAGQREDSVKRMIDLLISMWTSLAAACPAKHFGGQDPEVFFTNYLADRLRWRSLLARENSNDPLSGLDIMQAVLSNAEDAVAGTIAAIFRRNDRVMPGLWADWWRKARAVRSNPTGSILNAMA